MKTYLEFILPKLPFFLEGLLTTLEISGCAILLGIAVALLLTAMRLSHVKILHKIADVYISFMRGTPLLVQIFVIFYSVAVMGLNIPPFITGVISLSLNTGAFSAEILRGGLNAIPRGQYEAAEVLGISPVKMYVGIIFPQVFIMNLPALISEFINVIKMSPMVSVIAVVELTRVGQRLIASTYKPIPIYLTIMVMYLIITTIFEAFASFLKKKLAKFREET